MSSNFIFLLTIGLVYSHNFGYIKHCTKNEDCPPSSLCRNDICRPFPFFHHFNSAPLTCHSDDDCAGQKNHLCVRGVCEDFSKTSGHFTFNVMPCESSFDCAALPNHFCILRMCRKVGNKVQRNLKGPLDDLTCILLGVCKD